MITGQPALCSGGEALAVCRAPTTKKRTGPEIRADAQRWEVFDDWGTGIVRPAPDAVVR